jgi:aryl-alcohol dehydrogenase-like predicted oxidoreductase
MKINTQSLGKTKVKITPIGLGTWQFSEGKGGATLTWNAVSHGTCREIVAAALDGGINWFDTAELYGFGRSEKGLSNGLQAAGKKEGDVVIATKWMPLFRGASSIVKTIGKRIECLKPYSIDLHQIHFPYSLATRNAEMDAMAELLEAKKIRAAGVSNFSASQMIAAYERLKSRGYLLASNQVKYSLLDRRIEGNGILNAAKDLGTTIIAYSPLEMGLLSGKFHKKPELLNNVPLLRRFRLKRMLENTRPQLELLDSIAEKHKSTISQVALAWIINYHGSAVFAIPGATKKAHAKEAADSMNLKLTKTELSEIEEKTRQYINPKNPLWFL